VVGGGGGGGGVVVSEEEGTKRGSIPGYSELCSEEKMLYLFKKIWAFENATLGAEKGGYYETLIPEKGKEKSRTRDSQSREMNESTPSTDDNGGMVRLCCAK